MISSRKFSTHCSICHRLAKRVYKSKVYYSSKITESFGLAMLDCYIQVPLWVIKSTRWFIERFHQYSKSDMLFRS